MELGPLANPGPSPAIPLPLPSFPSLGSTFGQILISVFCCVMLYGLTVHQTYLYFRRFRQDTLFHRIWVLAILIVDTFHAVTAVHMCYYHLVSNYFNPIALATLPWSSRLTPTMLIFVVLLAQSFYARRIYLVSVQCRIIVFLTGIAMLAELGLCILQTVKMFQATSYTTLYNTVQWLDSAVFGVAILIDFTLTATFVLILAKSRTRFSRTNDKLTSLTAIAIVATALNTGLTIPALIFSITKPHDLTYAALALPVTEVYANSVLAFLNCREERPLKGSAVSNTNSNAELQPLPSYPPRMNASTATQHTKYDWKLSQHSSHPVIKIGFMSMVAAVPLKEAPQVPSKADNNTRN